MVTTSFHGCVFASLFERPLVTINSCKDNRRTQFLQRYGLEACECTGLTEQEIIDRVTHLDFAKFKEQVQADRKESWAYLSREIQEAGL